VFPSSSIEYDPTTLQAALFVDGVERVTGYAGATVSGGATANNFGLTFGSADDGTANFARVELDFGFLPTTTAVPEPGALTLFGIGVAGLALTRRRRRTRD
jgi:hypothetical protein